MRELEFNCNIYKQVQKRTAKRLFDERKTIYVISCNANPNSQWINGFYELSLELLEQKDDYIKEYDSDFQKHVNTYEYYNCNSELGKYAHFYIIAE